MDATADYNDFSWDFLTDELVHELLYEDMDDETLPKGTNRDVCADNVGHPHPNPHTVLSEVDSTLTLSDYGTEKISEIIMEFIKSPAPSTVIRHYPKEALHAKLYFVQDTSFRAPKILLDIFKKIATINNGKEDKMISGEIKAFENEALEYIAGYTLKKAFCRFPLIAVKTLCSDELPRRSSLLFMMERKAGSLKYPSDEYMYYVQHVYLKFAKETSRAAVNIQFDNVTKDILSGQFYESMVHRVCDMSGEDSVETDIRGLLCYVTKLMIRLFSHSFAKKLFERMHQRVTTGAVSLRSQLSN